MASPEIVIPRPENPVGDAAEAGFTLPSRYYLDADIHEREKEAIFYPGWHYVGHRAQLREAGDFVTARIVDESVFVIRGADGRLRGFYNVCRHRAHELLRGSGNVRSIVCPYHAWSYDDEGRLKHARHAERVRGFDAAEHCLPPVQVEEFLGLVFANLDPRASAFAELMGGLAEDILAWVPDIEELVPLARMEFGGAAIEANWKVVADNYLECYHCQKAHPAFAELIDIGAYQVEARERWSRQLGPKANARNSAYRFDADADVQHGGFWFAWPATTFNVVPGVANVSVLSIVPMGVGRTSFAGAHLGPAGTVNPPDRSAYVQEILGREDADLCESVQRGLRSRSYEQGRLMVDAERSGTAEHAVHHFQRLVWRALNP